MVNPTRFGPDREGFTNGLFECAGIVGMKLDTVGSIGIFPWINNGIVKSTRGSHHWNRAIAERVQLV